MRERLKPGSELAMRLRRLLPMQEKEATGALNSDVTKTLFTETFERLVAYVEGLMSSALREEGIASVVGRFTAHCFREHLFKRRGWENIQELLHEHDRILVTADGFDVMVGYFTAETATTSEGLDALKFERELLLALLQIVLNPGPMKTRASLLYDAHFCIAIPNDRFLEARELDRDRYRYRHKFAPIAWSGIELSALVRKRVAVLKKVADPKGPGAQGSGPTVWPLEVRLEKVMAKAYPELPTEVSFRFGSAPYKMPLFIYILRHTFWRPREVLWYYAALLAAADSYQRKRREVPSEYVRQIVAGVTTKVVEDEFFGEFKEAFRNLRQVVTAFRLAPQIVTWEEIGQRVGGLRFDVESRGGETGSLEWKVEIMYETGMLGVVLDKKRSERLWAFRHAFSFNEGHLLTEKLGRDEYPRFEFVLHPVFCEYLHLDTGNNPELVLAMDWEYLHQNEALRGSIAPS